MTRNQWTLLLLAVSVVASIGVIANLVWFAPSP